MTAATRPRYTLAEYVAFEAHANTKREYLDGQIWARAGGTPEHAALASAVIVSLGAQLRGRPCRTYTSDARIRVASSGLDTYPDVTVVCGREEYDRDDRLALTNPVLLVEVTSDSSEDYDRGEKLHHYQRIESLREVLIVSHRERRIERWRREGVAWIHAEARAGRQLELTSIGCTLDVDETYRNPLDGPG